MSWFINQKTESPQLWYTADEASVFHEVQTNVGVSSTWLGIRGGSREGLLELGGEHGQGFAREGREEEDRWEAAGRWP